MFYLFPALRVGEKPRGDKLAPKRLHRVRDNPLFGRSEGVPAHLLDVKGIQEPRAAVAIGRLLAQSNDGYGRLSNIVHAAVGPSRVLQPGGVRPAVASRDAGREIKPAAGRRWPPHATINATIAKSSSISLSENF